MEERSVVASRRPPINIGYNINKDSHKSTCGSTGLAGVARVLV